MECKTFKIYTLGCKVNQYDSSDLAMHFKKAGFEPAVKDASIAVVNSCAVTKTAMVKSRRMINLARKENPGAKIILAGCWGKIYKDIKAEDVNADFIMPEKDIAGLAEKLIGDSGNKRQSACGVPGDWSRSRYFLKIQDGCEQFCTYCVIPYARGKLRSEPEEKILKEVEAAVGLGYKEIVLCGIHLGLYGERDSSQPKAGPPLAEKLKIINYENSGLVDLIEKILKVEDLGRVRLSSIEVTEVTDKLMSLMARKRTPGKPYICKHLHIPLQSGCDKILKSMNRPYTTGQFADKLRKLRKLMPDIAITTDVITSFPGEAEKDHRSTCEFIKKQNFSRLHVFPFSAHEKTPAAKMAEQIDERTRQRRVMELRMIGRELEVEYKDKFKGKNMEIVIEKKDQERIKGKSEFYFDVFVNNKDIINSDSYKIKDIITLF